MPIHPALKIRIRENKDIQKIQAVFFLKWSHSSVLFFYGQKGIKKRLRAVAKIKPEASPCTGNPVHSEKVSVFRNRAGGKGDSGTINPAVIPNNPKLSPQSFSQKPFFKSWVLEILKKVQAAQRPPRGPSV